MFEFIIALPFGKVLHETQLPSQLKHDWKKCKHLKIETLVFATPGFEKVLVLQKTAPILKKIQNINPRYNLRKVTKFIEIWMSY